ncbi:hypothetical protein RHMOL_Rhmol05G0122600 [Rhododendron molle]|uniref:Uncharacterized protein n=1 Tax=Rhododendron molle TaxID=49168 RepID=A0ACC0NQK5_RHOML|nr:hypothetical protein RHMOL_Rhmol05G0122600 [Rhododendron molle]
MRIQRCSWRRFKMQFETDDSRISRFMGTITSFQVATPLLASFTLEAAPVVKVPPCHEGKRWESNGSSLRYSQGHMHNFSQIGVTTHLCVPSCVLIQILTVDGSAEPFRFLRVGTIVGRDSGSLIYKASSVLLDRYSDLLPTGGMHEWYLKKDLAVWLEGVYFWSFLHCSFEGVLRCWFVKHVTIGNTNVLMIRLCLLVTSNVFAASLGSARIYCPVSATSEYMYCVQEQNKVVSKGILEKAKGICTTHGSLGVSLFGGCAVISDAYNSHNISHSMRSTSGMNHGMFKRNVGQGHQIVAESRRAESRRRMSGRGEVQVLPIFNIPKTMLQVYGHSVYCISVSFPCGCMQELFQGYYFCQEREDFFQRAKPYKGHPTILRMQKLAKELGFLLSGYQEIYFNPGDIGLRFSILNCKNWSCVVCNLLGSVVSGDSSSYGSPGCRNLKILDLILVITGSESWKGMPEPIWCLLCFYNDAMMPGVVEATSLAVNGQCLWRYVTRSNRLCSYVLRPDLCFSDKCLRTVITFEAERGYRNALCNNMRFKNFLFPRVSKSKHKIAEKLLVEADRYDAASITDRSKLLNEVCILLFMLHGTGKNAKTAQATKRYYQGQASLYLPACQCCYLMSDLVGGYLNPSQLEIPFSNEIPDIQKQGVSVLMGYYGLQDLIESESAQKESIMNLKDGMGDYEVSLACKQFPSILFSCSPPIELYDDGLLSSEICKEFLSSSVDTDVQLTVDESSTRAGLEIDEKAEESSTIAGSEIDEQAASAELILDKSISFIPRFTKRQFGQASTRWGGIVRIQGDEFWHMTKVLRLSTKDSTGDNVIAPIKKGHVVHLVGNVKGKERSLVELFNGKGGIIEGCIQSIDRTGLEVEVLEDPQIVLPQNSQWNVFAAFGTLKGGRADWLVEKMHENRVDRLERVILAAAEQCQRLHEMTESSYQNWWPFTYSVATPVFPALSSFRKESSGSIIIGPEGVLPVLRSGNASKYRSLWCRLRSGVPLPEAQRQSMLSFLRDILHHGKELLSCTILNNSFYEI